MKKTRSARRAHRYSGEIRPEYRFDYRKARPNRFAARYNVGSPVVMLDPDVARAFPTSESVNAVLRALLETMPKASRR